MCRALPERSTISCHMFSKPMSNKGQARVLSHTYTHPHVRLRVRAARGYRRAQLRGVQRGCVHSGDGRRGVAPVVVCKETAACLHMLFHHLLSREVDKRLYPCHRADLLRLEAVREGHRDRADQHDSCERRSFCYSRHSNLQRSAAACTAAAVVNKWCPAAIRL